MKAPSAQLIQRILETLNWNGHVELGQNDLEWISAELSVALNPKRDCELCEVCDEIKPIVVTTAIGRICCDCIEDASGEVEAQKEILEDE